MKRIFSFLLVSIMILCVAGCRKTANISSDTTTSETLVSEIDSPEPSVSSTESEQQSSVPAPSVSQVASEQKPVSSAAPPALKPQGYTIKDYGNSLAPYTVNDPENTRGISTVKNGFGFGIASGGQPHSISVNNQAKFDSMANVDALALDTVSQDKRMYLTFDCGYEYKNLTVNILDTLKAKNIKAAFFVTLSYVKKNPAIVERMIKEGHIVGNHSATHPSFPDITRTKMAEEIYELDAYLFKHFNYKCEYFRFPSGEHSECSLELVSSLGHKSIFWSLAYTDYDTSKQMGAEKAFETVTGRFHSGAVILLHAVSKDNADILGRVIDKAIAEGYQFKTLENYYSEFSSKSKAF